jgi:hypothetical protein
VLYGVYAQHFIESFTRAGEPVPEPEMQGMVRVARALPEAPRPRLELAGELLREGKAIWRGG